MKDVPEGQAYNTTRGEASFLPLAVTALDKEMPLNLRMRPLRGLTGSGHTLTLYVRWHRPCSNTRECRLMAIYSEGL